MLLLGSLLALSAIAGAHTAGWHDGMFCQWGNVTGVKNTNNNLPVNPLYDMLLEDWWFQSIWDCPNFPPDDGVYLELEAGGSVMLELAHNIGQTTLSFDGQYAGTYPDGTDNTPIVLPGQQCVNDGALHTTGQSGTGGTSIAVSWVSDISQVTQDNLVVVSTNQSSPWVRETYYDIPAGLPPCPDAGCICSWNWVPIGCGIPNMYMHGYRCNITGATGTSPVGDPQTPVYCGDDSSKCVTGPKKILAYNQQTGNTVQQPANDYVSYHDNWGFTDGAQQNLIADSNDTSPVSEVSSSEPAGSVTTPPASSTSSTTSTTTSTTLSTTFSTKPFTTLSAKPSTTSSDKPSTTLTTTAKRPVPTHTKPSGCEA